MEGCLASKIIQGGWIFGWTFPSASRLALHSTPFESHESFRSMPYLPKRLKRGLIRWWFLWNFGTSRFLRSTPLAIPQFHCQKVPWIFCFFSWFWIGWFQEEFRFAMLKVTVQLVRTFEEDFQGNRAPVLVKVTWAPCWRSLRSDPNPFRGALLGCPWYLVN